MKLKYYLRGLGMGILVTAMITGVTNKNATAMTEEQIRAEARKLGMVEGSMVLSESDDTIEEGGLGEEESEQDEEASSEEEEEPQSETDVISQNSTEQDEVYTVSNNTATERADEAEVNALDETDGDNDKDNNNIKGVDATKTENAENESETAQNDTNTKTTTGEAIIVVNKGESSMIISTRLEAAGVVASALDFDKFLCAHGYDKFLHIGSHPIRIGASYDEIARILMSKP